MAKWLQTFNGELGTKKNNFLCIIKMLFLNISVETLMLRADKATRKAQELAEKYRRSDAEKKELVVMMETLLNNTEGFSEGTENFSE